MELYLYHFTDRETAASIAAEGFRDGEEGTCWLSPDPRTACGE